MAFGEPSKRDLEQEVSGLRSDLESTQGALNVARDNTLVLSQQRDLAEKALGAHSTAIKVMEDAESSDKVQISAIQTAEGVLKERYVGHAEARIADELISEHADAVLVEKGEEWDEEIRKRLEEKFDRDGTYDRVRRDVMAERIKKVGDELRNETRNDEEAQLEDPERQAALKEEARKQLEENGELERIRTEVRDKAQQDALGEVRLEIEAEELAKVDQLKLDFKAEWRNNYNGERFTEAVRRDLEAKWKGEAVEEVQAEVRDEELQALLDARVAREKERLKEEEFFAEHLEHFTSSGIDVLKLPEGASIAIYLGEQEEFTFKHAYRTGYNPEVLSEKKRVATKRLLNLTVLNDGRCMVESDSLSGSQSVYEQDAALAHGMIIHIGRQEIDKTNGDDAVPVLKESLREGVHLYYDDDKTDPAIMDTHLSIANVEINGHSALDLAPHRMVE